MKIAIVPLVAALCLLTLCAGAWSAESHLRVMTISGRAEVQKTGGSNWSPAMLRVEVEPGGAARSLTGRLTLKTESGQALRLAAGSRVTLLATALPDAPTRVRLDGGSIWAAVMPESPAGDQIEVQAGTVTVTVRRGGVGLALDRDGALRVRVYHGGAECTGPERRWSRVLAGDQELLISGVGVPADTHKLKRDDVDAPWEKWNEDQDLAGGYGSRPPAS